MYVQIYGCMYEYVSVQVCMLKSAWYVNEYSRMGKSETIILCEAPPHTGTHTKRHYRFFVVVFFLHSSFIYPLASAASGTIASDYNNGSESPFYSGATFLFFIAFVVVVVYVVTIDKALMVHHCHCLTYVLAFQLFCYG